MRPVNQIPLAPESRRDLASRSKLFPNAGYWFIALLAFTVVGFWPSYFSGFFSAMSGNINRYHHAHAIVMTLWIAMLITQPFLIRSGRRSLHRKLGKASYFLFPLTVIVTYAMAHHGLRIWATEIPSDVSGRAGNFALVNSIMLGFIIAYALAIYYRTKAAMHARFMICTGLSLIGPSLGRVLDHAPQAVANYRAVIEFGMIEFILLVLILVERRRGQGNKAFPIMLAVFTGTQILLFTMPKTDIWRAVTAWYMQLPLTS